ncbi:hypothetical protein SY86_04740 [Erwinia tracheiphila]|uniref:Uncharacterized protein n=1 Tax=Erwinia tracheiphila TaxID=65700 RepID=A0A0M2K7I4_9GAMM|nr:hypothetical protein ETR_01806 [Erwinia tracheiphila PSU-1]KKF34894.1 hypothetical protein SY86_04740 [Erwinia tracheiphila]
MALSEKLSLNGADYSPFELTGWAFLWLSLVMRFTEIKVGAGLSLATGLYRQVNTGAGIGRFRFLG